MMMFVVVCMFIIVVVLCVVLMYCGCVVSVCVEKLFWVFGFDMFKYFDGSMLWCVKDMFENVDVMMLCDGCVRMFVSV